MRIVIIGNGIAGTNAARHIRKNSEHEIIMVSEETLRPFSRTALMYVYMGHVKQENTEMYEDWFWEKNRIGRVQSKVLSVDTAQKSLQLSNGMLITFVSRQLHSRSATRFRLRFGIDLAGRFS